jgi:hypothetical protein
MERVNGRPSKAKDMKPHPEWPGGQGHLLIGLDTCAFS